MIELKLLPSALPLNGKLKSASWRQLLVYKSKGHRRSFRPRLRTNLCQLPCERAVGPPPCAPVPEAFPQAALPPLDAAP